MSYYHIDQSMLESVLKEMTPKTIKDNIESTIATIDRIIYQLNLYNQGKRAKDKEKINPLYKKIQYLYQILLDYHQYEDVDINQITHCQRILNIKTNIPNYYYSKVHHVPYVNISGIYALIDVYIIPYNPQNIIIDNDNEAEEQICRYLVDKYIGGELHNKADHLNLINNRLAVAIDMESWINEFIKTPKNYKYLNIC